MFQDSTKVTNCWFETQAAWMMAAIKIFLDSRFRAGSTL